MKKILYLVVVMLLLVVVVGCGKKETNKTSTNSLKEEYTYNDLVFKNTNINKNGSTAIITSTLTNKSENSKDITWVVLNITLKNNETYKVIIYFGDKINGHQTLQTTTTVDFDIDNIAKIEYEFDEKR